MSAVKRAAPDRIPVAQAASDFLSQKRIAVTGVSRDQKSGHGSNVVYQRLRERGYEVFPVNPNAKEIGGATCYPNLASIPGRVGAVVIGTRPETAASTIEECGRLGIEHVWMHRSIGGGSVSHPAAERGRELGLTVIEGGCPLMFEPVSDGAHRSMRFVFTLFGRVPRTVLDCGGR